MANLPLVFAELLGGGVLLAAGISGSPIADVVDGKMTWPPTPLETGSSGGSTTAAGATGVTGPVNAQGLANPFSRASSFTLGRTDMGVDASMSPGSPILALADSTLVNVEPSWYQGQPAYFFRIDNGPNAGRFWYIAEQIRSSLSVGQSVKAGQQIGSYAGSGTGIEIGWAGNATQTQAQATTGYTEGQQTPAGQSFRSLLNALGLH